MCRNLTWKKQELLTFRRVSLKMKNILIENILPGNNNSEWKALFLIEKCTVKIQNVRIKGCEVTSSMWLHKISAVLLLQNSYVKMRDMEVIGNSFQYLARIESSFLRLNDISLSNNIFNGALFSIEKSNLKLNDAEFHSNKFVSLLDISLNSDVLITNNILNGNKIFENGYFIAKSNIQLNNVAITRNELMQDMLLLTTGSTAIVQNNTFSENNVSKSVFNLFRKNRIQLNYIGFTRNKVMENLLYMGPNYSAIIKNNMLSENIVSGAVYISSMVSTIKLHNVTFTENKFMQDLLQMQSNSSAIIENNVLTGNNLNGRAFHAHSSSLIMNTISLDNNTIANYFIWASSSNNVSLDLMRIKENRFRDGIIHIENCASRLANTYIENYDRLSVSAISVTSTYKGHKYFPFELKNTTIIWNYGSLLSIRPIIELTGRINISNVIVSVSSIPEIEVLRYSTKDVIVERPYYKVFSNVYAISALFISCKRAHVKHIATSDTIICTPCLWDTYTLNNGLLNISSKHLTNKKYEFEKETTNFTCYNCPVGGNCTEHIKSRSNFYGYVTKQRKVEFISCPLNYCCTTDQCKTITSCKKGRSGTLCGRCSKNNTENFLSTNCISVNCCQNFGKFWLIYFVYALSLATCLYYMRDLTVLIKTTGGRVSKVLKCFRKEKESEDENDEMISISGSEEHPEEKIAHFTMSGIIALIVSFYQIKQVITIDVKYKNTIRFSFITDISKFMNLEIIAINSSYYCPMNDLNAVSKALIKTYLLTVALLMASLLNYLISRLYYSFGGKLGRGSSLKPSDRFGVCLIRVLMLNYKNMATVSLILINCVEVASNRVLHVNGDIKCFEWWQVIVAVFFCTWILFFPLSLKFSYSMFMKDQITFPQLIISLMIPFALVVYHVLNRNVVLVVLQTPRNVSKVKNILKEMFEEPYRLKTNCSREESIFYETWRLYQRVLLAFVATYCINPISRITFMTPIIILIAISYIAYRPYKPEMNILHWMEVVSILGFFVCLVQNMFRGFLYMYDINYDYTITLVWEAFTIADLLFSPIWVLFWFLIIKPVYSKAENAIKKRI